MNCSFLKANVEPKAPTKLGTIDALTGLRFIAALSVLIGHAAFGVMVFQPAVGFVNYLTVGPAIGMPLFFVLSGFVIHYNYGADFRAAFVGPTIDFFIARFARLYPLYILLLAFYIFNQRMLPGIFSGNYDLTVFPRFLLLWQAWSIDYRSTTWFGHLLLPPAWSVSVEVFFYGIYPLIAARILMVRSPFWAAAFLAALIAVFYMMIAVCYDYFDALRVWGNNTFHINADPQNALLGWLLNTGPIGPLFEFLMGVCAAQLYSLLYGRPAGHRENAVGSCVLVLSLAAACAFYGTIHFSPFVAFAGTYPGGMSPFFVVIIFCCARYENVITRALAAPAMIALGDASYSIYLIHFFTLQLFSLQEPFIYNHANLLVWIFTILGATLITITIALGTYRVVEVPCRTYLRHYLHRVKQSVLELLPRAGGFGNMPRFAILGVFSAAFIAWNWPQAATINVVDATYGRSCRAVSPPSPHVNTFHEGNATTAVEQSCVGSTRCNYRVDVNKIGDPVSGCAKDFEVIYRCPSDNELKGAFLRAEANGRSLVLDCQSSRVQQ